MNEHQQIDQGGPEPKALPLYTCHKQVRAAKIVGFELDPAAVTEYVSLAFDNDSPSGVVVDADWLATRVRPNIGEGMERDAVVKAAAEKAIGGYYVAYEDGHTSWSPAEAFESGYAPTAEAVLSTREQADGEDDDESVWPESTADMAFTTVHNGHVEGTGHGDVVMQRVICMSSAEEKHFYALFTEYAGTPAMYLEVQCGTFTEVGVNGFTLENLLAIVIDRLELFQATEFKCQENKMAIHYARLALSELNARTAKRIERGVEGTSQI